jgi:hypothetical protein
MVDILGKIMDVPHRLFGSIGKKVNKVIKPIGKSISKGAKGTPGKIEKVETLSKEQQKLLRKTTRHVDVKDFDVSKDKTFMAGQNFVKDMLNPSSKAYAKFEKPYMKQFQKTLMPKLAQRFAQQNAMGGGGLKAAAEHEAGSLSERLAALRTQGMGNAAQQAMKYAQVQPNIYQNMINTSLGTPSQGFMVMPGEEGWGQALLGGAAQGAGQGLSNWASRPAQPQSPPIKTVDPMNQYPMQLNYGRP